MGGRQQGDDIRVDMVLLQYLVYQLDSSLIRQIGIAAAFQHTGIPSLEAQREDIVGHIGTCFINHADDTEGHRHPVQAQTVGQRLGLGDMTQRRG